MRERERERERTLQAMRGNQAQLTPPRIAQIVQPLKTSVAMSVKRSPSPILLPVLENVFLILTP